MMSVTHYCTIADLPEPDPMKGGQELILFEICALLEGYKFVWLPFIETESLPQFLKGRSHLLIVGDKEGDADALYFGTPTIVNDQPFFERYRAERWTKKTERLRVRELMGHAVTRGVRRVVCGLGSGDISVRERQEDMLAGCKEWKVKPKLVTEKLFTDPVSGYEFRDWVICGEMR